MHHIIYLWIWFSFSSCALGYFVFIIINILTPLKIFVACIRKSCHWLPIFVVLLGLSPHMCHVFGEVLVKYTHQLSQFWYLFPISCIFFFKWKMNFWYMIQPCFWLSACENLSLFACYAFALLFLLWYYSLFIIL